MKMVKVFVAVKRKIQPVSYTHLKIAQVVNAPAAKVARVIAAYAAKSAVESAVESGEGAAA